jgi:hypothetical protein
MYSNPVSKVVQNIAYQHTIAPNHKKRKWLSLVADAYTTEELRDQGFQFCKSAVATARKHALHYKPGAEPPVPKQPLSKKRKTVDVVKHVASFLLKDVISRAAPNRSI